MLLANSQQVKTIDLLTTEKYGVPSLLLMECAGSKVAEEAISSGAKNIVILAGKGNNGGDGSVAARHLFGAGKKVLLVMTEGTDKLTNDAKRVFEIASEYGVEIHTGFTENVKNALKECDLIIDAMLGAGTKGDLKEPYSLIVEFINSLQKDVIAIDLPTGVNCDNGTLCGMAIRCKKTVTFGTGRLGLMLYPAKDYAGEISVADIGFNPLAVKETDIKARSLEYIKPDCLSNDCHKGSVGKVLVVAGSRGMTGAAYLASTAALRGGSGVVSLCIPKAFNSVMERKLTEVMTIPVEDNGITMTASASAEIIKHAKSYNVIVTGCGLGCNDETKDLMKCIIGSTDTPLVIDADGINSITKEELTDRKNIVITPHIGEMSRLTGMSAEYIKSNLVAVASDFANAYKVTVVLKCATTVVAFPDGEVYVNTLGNRGMATAGSGDVLAGIIGAQIARYKDIKSAVINGVWLHSAAGDDCAKRLGVEFMSAGDIIDSLKFVLNP